MCFLHPAKMPCYANVMGGVTCYLDIIKGGCGTHCFKIYKNRKVHFKTLLLPDVCFIWIKCYYKADGDI